MSNINKLLSDKRVMMVGAVVASIITIIILFNQMFYLNNGSSITYIQTKFPTQSEKVVEGMGYYWLGFGTATPFPRQMTIQSVSDSQQIQRDNDSGLIIQSFPITFLGGTTATVDSNVRVSLPTGPQFLKLAQTYRTPEGFATQAITPVMKSTLQSTAQMMSADDYFGGGGSEFRRAFTDQMSDGMYVVKRVERQVQNSRRASGTAVAQNGTEQGEFEQSSTSTVIGIELVRDESGLPIRLDRQFSKLGVGVVDANIMNVDPSPQFKQRMIGVQESQARLMIARQDRQTADEQKQLVTANGEMEVEKRRQDVLRDQVEQTTKAETIKQLALIEATREQERSVIERETAQINMEKSIIEAKTRKQYADAEAYAKRVVIEADGALAQKLEALVEIARVNAEAAAKAPTPGVVMGSSGSGASRQSEIGDMLNVMTLNAARELNLNMKVK